MSEQLKADIRNLTNRDAGWVDRRDAADSLGAAASQALAALHAHKDESDVDVQIAVRKALGIARSGLDGIAAVKPDSGYALKDLVKGLERPPKRIVTPSENGFLIDVTVGENRKQQIHVEHHEPKKGMQLVRVFTRCGAPKEDSYRWALQTNMDFAQCALALTEEDGQEMLWLVNNFLASHVTPQEIKMAVKEIAYYGDWIEKKMTGADEF